jgi:hypothetical protein
MSLGSLTAKRKPAAPVLLLPKRQPCRTAILHHVPANAAAAYARKLKRERDRLRRKIAIRLAPDSGDAP